MKGFLKKILFFSGSIILCLTLINCNSDDDDDSASPVILSDESLISLSTIAGVESESGIITVFGDNLIADVNVTVDDADNFSISSDNSAWGAEITLAQSSGMVTDKVYVRIKSSASAGSHSASISLSSESAGDETVVVAGQVNPVKTAKYVFMFIGDGMSEVQISSTQVYKASLAAQADPDYINSSTGLLNMTQLPASGFATTYDSGTYITDSASAGTALATGYKTLSGVINYDTTKTITYTTIAEAAKASGMKVGVISSVSLDHATPASYYAKEKSRNNYYNISKQLVNSNFDFFGGGGFNGSTGADGSIVDLAAAAGYTVVDSRAEFDALTNSSGKVIANNAVLDSSNALPYDLIRDTGAGNNDISLAEYTAKAIELLNNANGFFLMVEGGKIDWACHANDAKSAIQDTIAFDDALAKALDFYASHPDETLIVVTGDHECGGMTIGFSGTKYATAFKTMQYQNYSFDKFDRTYISNGAIDAYASLADMYAGIENAFGLDMNKDGSADYQISNYQQSLLEAAFDAQKNGKPSEMSSDEFYVLYGGYNPLSVTLTHVINQKSGIGWTSYSHTGVPVPVYVKGVNENNFNGYYDNTDIPKKMAAAMGLAWPFVSAK